MSELDHGSRTLRIESLAEYREVAHALSHESRVRILELLQHGPMNLSRIADAVELPLATVTRNVQMLEAAGLLSSELRSGTRGVQRVCSLRHERIVLDLAVGEAAETTVATIPVGHYVAFDVTPTCGFATATGPADRFDDPAAFRSPEARSARLLWFTTGFVEYHVPNPALPDAEVTAVEFVAELCSEIVGSRSDWPSGITLWIDDVEVGTWISPGDFGGRRGRFSPPWWPEGVSQYGIRTAWRVSAHGTSINGVSVSGTTVDELEVAGRPYLSVRLGVKSDTEHPHGLNLFGRGFGDFDDDPRLFIEHAR